MFSLLKRGPLWQKPSDLAASGLVFTTFLSLSPSLLFLRPLASLYRYLSAKQQPKLVSQVAWRQRSVVGRARNVRCVWHWIWLNRKLRNEIWQWTASCAAYNSLYLCNLIQKPPYLHPYAAPPIYFSPDSMFQMKNDISQVFVVLEENIFPVFEDCTSIFFC